MLILQLLSSTLASSAGRTTRSTTSRRLHAVGHHASACKGYNQHEQPVGNQTERPHGIAVGHRETELRDLAVEGVEPRIQQHEASLVLGLGRVELDEVLRRSCGHVESLLVNLHGSRRRKHIDGPDASRAGGPGIAQNRLVIAVDNAHEGRTGDDGKLGCRFVEGLFDCTTVAWGEKEMSKLVKVW